MKKILPLLITVALIITVGTAWAKRMSVVDCYNLLDGDDITLQKGKWAIMSHTIGEFWPVTVDIKNGFLSWVDPGTGGGDSTTEAALFISRSGKKILAVATRSSTGIGYDSTIEFYELKGKKMQKNFSLVPKITPLSFYSGSKSNPELTQYKACLDEVSPQYHLPRHGLIIKITPDFTSIMRSIANDSKTTDASMKRAEKFFNSKEWKDLKLYFDARQGTFMLIK